MFSTGKRTSTRTVFQYSLPKLAMKLSPVRYSRSLSILSSPPTISPGIEFTFACQYMFLQTLNRHSHMAFQASGEKSEGGISWCLGLTAFTKQVSSGLATTSTPDIHLQIIEFPSRLVVFVPAQSDPKVGHPFVEDLLVYRYVGGVGRLSTA